MVDLQIYCNCYQYKEPMLNQFNQKNIMCGAYNYDKDYKKELISKNYILDDTGENISDLNNWFGELTGTYWVWKNTDHEIVGTTQYRHFWETNFLKIEPNTIYVVKKINVMNAIKNNVYDKISIYDHYGICHGYDGWKLLYDLCETEDIPLKSSMIDQLRFQQELIPFNMFIAEKKIFNKVCNILFDIILTYYKNYKDLLSLMSEKTKQNRIIDFLSERILHMIYTNINYYINNVKIVTLNIRTYEKSKT